MAGMERHDFEHTLNRFSESRKTKSVDSRESLDEVEAYLAID